MKKMKGKKGKRKKEMLGGVAGVEVQATPIHCINRNNQTMKE